MRRQVVKLAILTVVVCWPTGCSTNEETISSQKQSNWAEADTAAITAAEPEPQRDIMPDTHFAAGQLFEKKGTFNKAIVQYQKALAIDPEHVPSLNRLGLLYSRMNRHVDAENALLRGIEIRPDSALLRNNLGFEYVLQERWADAEAEFRNSLQLKPGFARARINLGLSLAKLERFDEALEQFRTVLPEPDAFYNLGLMFRSKHRYRDAADAFMLTLDFDPDFHAARKQLAQIQPQLELSTDLEPVLDEVQWQALAGEAVERTLLGQPPRPPAVVIDHAPNPMPPADQVASGAETAAEQPAAPLRPGLFTHPEPATGAEDAQQEPDEGKVHLAANPAANEELADPQTDGQEYPDGGMTMVEAESIPTQDESDWLPCDDQEEMIAELAPDENIAVPVPEQPAQPDVELAEVIAYPEPTPPRGESGPVSADPTEEVDPTEESSTVPLQQESTGPESPAPETAEDPGALRSGDDVELVAAVVNEESVAALPRPQPEQLDTDVATVAADLGPVPTDDELDLFFDVANPQPVAVLVPEQAEEPDIDFAPDIEENEAIPFAEELISVAEVPAEEWVGVLLPDEPVEPDIDLADITRVGGEPEAIRPEEELIVVAQIPSEASDAAPAPKEPTPLEDDVAEPPAEPPAMPPDEEELVVEETLVVEESSAGEEFAELQADEPVQPIYPTAEAGEDMPEPEAAPGPRVVEAIVAESAEEPVVARRPKVPQPQEVERAFIVLEPAWQPLEAHAEALSGIAVRDPLAVLHLAVPQFPATDGTDLGEGLNAAPYENVWQALACGHGAVVDIASESDVPRALDAEVASVMQKLLDQWRAAATLVARMKDLPVQEFTVFEPVASFLTGSDAAPMPAASQPAEGRPEPKPAADQGGYVSLPPELLPIEESPMFEAVPSQSDLYRP